MVCSSLGFSVHGILQARILEWVAIAFSRGSSWPRDWTHVSHVSCIGRWTCYHWPIREAPSAFPSYVPWGCWGSRGRNRTTNLLLAGSAAADKVVTQPRGTMTLHIYEVEHSVLQSHPPHFMFLVASCGQVPWCWTEQMFKKSRHHREFYWTVHPRSLRAAEGTLAPGRLCMCYVNPSIFICFFFFVSFHQSEGFENLVPFKLSTGGTLWLGSTTQRLKRITPWGPRCELIWQVGWRSSSTEL